MAGGLTERDVYCMKHTYIKTNIMKTRIILTLLAAFFTTGVFAQTRIQDTFYGVTMHSTYAEMKKNRELRDILKDKYQYSNWMYRHAYDWEDGKKERVTFEDMNLGGRNWSYCDYYFNEDEIFYRIRFYKGMDDFDSTRKMYESLLEDLMKKYGDTEGIEITTHDNWQDNLRISTTFTGNNGMTCILTHEYSASKSGQMFYYVFLHYYDTELKEEADNIYLKEL